MWHLLLIFPQADIDNAVDAATEALKSWSQVSVTERCIIFFFFFFDVMAHNLLHRILGAAYY